MPDKVRRCSSGADPPRKVSGSAGAGTDLSPKSNLSWVNAEHGTCITSESRSNRGHG
ncbi:hypothetical protein BGW80DRAFT_1365996, partial [Lactifluus volemus]